MEPVKIQQEQTKRPLEPPILISHSAVRENKIVCDMCGYANPEFTAQCKKCSNYL